MNYTEFKRHIGKAGLSINEFAALIKVKPSSVSNYAKKTAIPEKYAVIAVLLGDAADRGINFRDLFARFNIDGLEKAHSKLRVISHIDQYREKPK